VYSFLFAPNHLGLRHDLSLLSRAFSDNALAFVLFNLLGLVPFINNCLMWPALRSQGLQVRQHKKSAHSQIHCTYTVYSARLAAAAASEP
jgi:hypothetical protein